MKLFLPILISIGAVFTVPDLAFAATNPAVDQFANQSLTTFITIASVASILFLIRGGYHYITSTGNPEELDHAKKTIRNTLIGLTLIIGSGVLVSLLQNAFLTPSTPGSTQTMALQPIEPAEPEEGLTQVLIDAVVGFLQTIIQSATKPIVDGIITFLTTVPSFAQNSVVFNLWLVIVGIVDSLFLILVAILGFKVMSTSVFGFDELEFKHLLPRIGLAFLGANVSIFLIDWMLSLSNVLIQAILASTGGLTEAWVLNAFDPGTIGTNGQGTAVITLIFMLLFIILAIVLLLYYIGRLITLSVGAVLSPFIFLLWLLPGFADFAIVAARSYVIVIFTVFIHVVIIQLAASFLTIPGQSGTNSIISILVGVATLFTLLKTPGMIMQFAFYSASGSALRKLGGQIIHVISSRKVETPSPSSNGQGVTPRKQVAL